MTKIRSHVHNPDDPKAMSERLTDAGRALDATTQFGGVYFGHPANPFEEDDTTLAGSTNVAHNGLIENIKGSWAEVEIGADELDTAVQVFHNLGITPLAANQPNVRWVLFGVQYDRTQAGTKTYWEDLRSPGSAGRGQTSPPDFTASGSDPFNQMPLNWFDKTTTEYLSYEFHMPHNYVEGTNVLPHVHWVPKTTAASDNQWPRWGLNYSWANMDTSAAASAFPTISTIYSDAVSEPVLYSDDVKPIINTHYVTRINGATGISGSGKNFDGILACQLFRDAADGDDDYDDDAGVLHMDLHYQVDAIHGSEAVDDKADDTGEFINFDCYYDPSDSSVLADSIKLRFTAHHNVQDSNTYKIKFTLFFVPAVR